MTKLLVYSQGVMVKTYKIDKLEENMILAEDIVDNNGTVILAKDTELSNRNINMLGNLGFAEIKIKLNREESKFNNNKDSNFEKELLKSQNIRAEENKKLKIIYNDTVDQFEHLYNKTKENEKINIEKVNAIMEPVLDRAFNNTSIMSTFMTLNEQLGEYTYKHSINVGLFSSMIGKWLGFKEKEIKELATAGVLHDIGKSKTPSAIINKPARLTKEEFEIIKKHPQDGYDLIKDDPSISEAVKMAVYQHHEKIDGTGYPNGLKLDEIHTYAKIIAVADVYDSLTSVRSYKEAICPFTVYEMLLDMAQNHLDYYITSTFIKKISNFFVGSYVKLTNGEKAKIVLLNKTVLTRPLLLSASNEYIDLSKDYNIKIEEIL